MLGEPNVFGAFTAREKKRYDQNLKHSVEASEMTKDWMRNPKQSTATHGGISTDHSSKKIFFTSTSYSKECFESSQKEDQKLVDKSPEVNIEL